MLGFLLETYNQAVTKVMHMLYQTTRIAMIFEKALTHSFINRLFP